MFIAIFWVNDFELENSSLHSYFPNGWVYEDATNPWLGLNSDQAGTNSGMTHVPIMSGKQEGTSGSNDGLWHTPDIGNMLSPTSGVERFTIISLSRDRNYRKIYNPPYFYLPTRKTSAPPYTFLHLPQNLWSDELYTSLLYISPIAMDELM